MTMTTAPPRRQSPPRSPPPPPRHPPPPRLSRPHPERRVPAIGGGYHVETGHIVDDEGQVIGHSHGAEPRQHLDDPDVTTVAELNADGSTTTTTKDSKRSVESSNALVPESSPSPSPPTRSSPSPPHSSPKVTQSTALAALPLSARASAPRSARAVRRVVDRHFRAGRGRGGASAGRRRVVSRRGVVGPRRSRGEMGDGPSRGVRRGVLRGVQGAREGTRGRAPGAAV